MTEHTQLAVRRSNQMAPWSLNDLKSFAGEVANSSFCPSSFRGKTGDVLVAMQYGLEVGLAPMAALQNIAVINGRPAVWGDAMLALAQAHPRFVSINETVDDKTMTARCEVVRRGMAPVVQTFSRADAQAAGLWGKPGPWKQYPKRMLQMRARSFALRDAFADALKGIIAAEEAGDIIDITPEPVKAEPAKSELEKQMEVNPDYALDYLTMELGEAFERGEGAEWWKANQNLIRKLTPAEREDLEGFKEKLKQKHAGAPAADSALSPGATAKPAASPVAGAPDEGTTTPDAASADPDATTGTSSKKRGRPPKKAQEAEPEYGKDFERAKKALDDAVEINQPELFWDAAQSSDSIWELTEAGLQALEDYQLGK